MTNNNSIDKLSARIDKMAEWAKTVEARLKEANHAQRAEIEDVDYGAELAELARKHVGELDDIRSQRESIIATELNIAQLQDTISAFEDNALIEVSMEIGENGKPIYSNESQRKAAVKSRLALESKYAEAVENLRINQASIAKSKAEIEYLEAQQKNYHYQLRALMARIENQTARINAQMETTK